MSQAFANRSRAALSSNRAWPGRNSRGDPHIDGALLVGFLREGIHAGTGLTQLSGDPGQVYEFEDVVITVGSSDDAFRTYNDGAGRFGEDGRNFIESVSRKPGTGGQLLE